MRRLTLLLAVLLTLCSASTFAIIPRYSTNPDDFVSSHLGHFWVDGQPFRFVGFNMRGFNYYGYSYYDNGSWNEVMASTQGGDRSTNLYAMYTWGAKVARVFVPFNDISVNEVANQLEKALNDASLYDVRLICVLTDSYGVTRFCPPDDLLYHTEEPGALMSEYWYHQAYQYHYKPMVLNLVNRFKNDPTVFCWQLGNEMKCPWEAAGGGNDLLPVSQDMASAIRSIDPNHMVSLGTAGTEYSFLNDQEARDVYANFDFLTVHAYNGADMEKDDAVLAQELGKPLIIEEAGFDGDNYDSTTRAQATDADIAKWVGRGARGYMNWAFCALSSVRGDCEHYGVDYAKHGTTDWNNYKAVYTKWANIFSSTPRPAPEKAANVQATDGVYTDRVEVTWDPAWAADEYAVYRSEPLSDPNAVVNVMPYALSYAECGHLDANTTGDKISDGDVNTKWACAHDGAAGSKVHSIAFDLGSTCKVSKLVVKHASSGGEPVSLNTAYYYIEQGSSINGPWTVLYSVNNYSAQAANTFNLSTPKDIRYIRLRTLVTNPSTDSVVRIPEFEVWGIPGAGLTRKISDWQTATSFVDTTAVPGVNYLYSVNARNETGESGNSADDGGYAEAASPITIGQAKASEDGTGVYVTGGVVSAVYGGSFYIQQSDRTGGIRVAWDGAVTEGSAVNVSGTITTVGGERTITASAVSAAQ